MKLPDFFAFEPLAELKRRMGIADDTHGSFSVEADPHRLTREELDALSSPHGVDVSLDNLHILDDGTLAYKDRRVLLYIRDVNQNATPRYHISNCATLQTMKQIGRFDKYVVSTRTDGIFSINIINNGISVNETQRLSVCQNCLNLLNFDGFSFRNWNQKQRNAYVNRFIPLRFFEVFPQSLITTIPRFTSDTAPLNTYNTDFSSVSLRFRQQRGWRCEGQNCGIYLGDPQMRRFLHVHHVNGVRSDDRSQNIKVLCIECHAKAPKHGQMRHNPDYREFLTAKHRRPR